MNATQRKLPIRISLRIVAILVTVLCLALGWTVRQADRTRRKCYSCSRLDAVGCTRAIEEARLILHRGFRPFATGQPYKSGHTAHESFSARY